MKGSGPVKVNLEKVREFSVSKNGELFLDPQDPEKSK